MQTTRHRHIEKLANRMGQYPLLQVFGLASKEKAKEKKKEKKEKRKTRASHAEMRSQSHLGRKDVLPAS
jgi:hypothetical protein